LDGAEFQGRQRASAIAESFHQSLFLAEDSLFSEAALSGDLASCPFPFFLDQLFMGRHFHQIVPILCLLFLFHKERVNILPAIFVISDDFSLFVLAPFFDDVARKEHDLRCNEIIIKKVSRA
jgi:hypothetical protein